MKKNYFFIEITNLECNKTDIMLFSSVRFNVNLKRIRIKFVR